MIDTDSAGGALSATYTTRMAEKWLDATRAPVDTILLCRKISGTWYTRDVSDLWTGGGNVVKEIAREYGTSVGNDTGFIFDNVPIGILGANYTSGTTLTITGRLHPFTLAADDWIAVSDYDSTEYRRVSSVTYDSDGLLTSIVITEALDEDYDSGDSEIRFLPVIHNTKNRLESDDFGNGWIKVNSHFADISEATTQYLGKITSWQIAADNTYMLTCRDRVRELEEYEITERIEFDDRGVATVPTESGWNGEGTANAGNGTISDITYPVNKWPRIDTTETWTLTYDGTSTPANGGGGFDVSGGITGSIFPADTSEANWPPTGERDEFDPDARLSWHINAFEATNTSGVSIPQGWSLTIEEGDIPFQDGDSFKFHTQAEGTISVVKGKGYTTNPIDTTNLTALYPSYIVEYVIRYLLAWQHDDPEASTGLLMPTGATDSLGIVRTLGQDYYTELRGGFFEPGTRAIEIIDAALVTCLGWIAATHDDHIDIFYYSPYMLASPTSFTFSRDADHPSRTHNVIEAELAPMAIDQIRNRVKFHYNTADRQKEIEVDDSTSQTEFGERPFVIRGEDYTDYTLSTRFHSDDDNLTNSANRILKRVKDPLQRIMLTCHPHAMLLEVGDTPLMYSRDLQFSAKRIWVTRIEKHLKQRVVKVEGELGTHIQGKYAVVQNDPAETPSNLWDATGYVGAIGDERKAYAGDATLQLDGIGNNNAAYNPRLGKPDQWGNYVEDNFIAS